MLIKYRQTSVLEHLPSPTIRFFTDHPFMLTCTCVISLTSLRQQKTERVSMSQFTANPRVVNILGNCAVNIFMVFFAFVAAYY